MHQSKEVSNKKKASDDRKHISEGFVAEFMGLNEDWMDIESIADLPRTLPQTGGRKMSRDEGKELVRELDLLVAWGCHQPVLYWCLEQLGPGADQRRTPRLPTREDMESITARISSAAEAVDQYQDLLLETAVAMGDTLQMPEGFLTGRLDNEVEAMLLLRQLLAWVRKPAAYWQSPNVGRLMKSKGILFLLAYVWIHTKQSTATGGRPRGQRSRSTKPYRIARQYANTIATIADLYCGIQIRAEDLVDKLDDFHSDYPNLFGRMVGLLRSLDDVWRIEEGQREWIRLIPRMPPPDRGRWVSCLAVSDPEMRSAIAATATLVKGASLKTPESAHEHFGGLIYGRLISKGKAVAEAQSNSPADPPSTESTPGNILSPETKKPVRSDKRRMRQPSGPSQIKKG